MVNEFKYTVIHFARPGPLKKKYEKSGLNHRPLGRRGPRGRLSFGPPGTVEKHGKSGPGLRAGGPPRAAGRLSFGPPGRRGSLSAGLLLANPASNGSLYVLYSKSIYSKRTFSCVITVDKPSFLYSFQIPCSRGIIY